MTIYELQDRLLALQRLIDEIENEWSLRGGEDIQDIGETDSLIVEGWLQFYCGVANMIWDRVQNFG